MTMSARLTHFIDAVLVIWIAAWIVMGVFVFHEVKGLMTLSNTMVTAGQAVDKTGTALGTLKSIPFVGDRIGALEREIHATARSAIASGRSSRKNIQNLSVLLGLSVGLIPTIPLLALYAPFRLNRVREVRTVRRSLREYAADPGFEEFLARRAAQNLPYHQLRAVSSHPWDDIREGRHRKLADAELRRLGIRGAPAPPPAAGR